MPRHRSFEMPEWAKTGPIDLKNYDWRTWQHCTERSAPRCGVHPTIKLNSSDFALWHEYFAHHLGGFPWCMKALIARDIESITVAESVPQWFDPSFMPTPGYRAILPRDPEVPPEEAIRVCEKFNRLLAELGRSSRMDAVQRPKFTRYTDEQLRARYSKPDEGLAE